MTRTYHILIICGLVLCQRVFCQCPSTQTLSVGYSTVTITSPNYPNVYDINLNCKWVGSTTADSLLLRVTGITVNCAGDAINVYAGTDNSGTQLHNNECSSSGGRNLGYDVITPGNVYISFTSDGSTSSSETGFKAYMIRAKDFSGTGCSSPQSLTATSATQYISNPNFPNAYSPNTNCKWEITTQDSSANVVLNVLFYEIEKDPSCQYDYLEIQKSETDEKICNEDTDNTWIPNKSYTSTGTSLTIMFIADNLNNRRGFMLSYSQTDTSASSSNSSSSSSTDNDDHTVAIALGVGLGLTVVVGISILGAFLLKKSTAAAGRVGVKKSSPTQDSNIKNENNPANNNNNKGSDTFLDYSIFFLPYYDTMINEKPIFIMELEP